MENYSTKVRRQVFGFSPLKKRRVGAAAVEFALCLPGLCLVLTGLLEVGRITEVTEVMWNSAREAARDASIGNDIIQAVTMNLLS